VTKQLLIIQQVTKQVLEIQNIPSQKLTYEHEFLPSLHMDHCPFEPFVSCWGKHVETSLIHWQTM